MIMKNDLKEWKILKIKGNLRHNGTKNIIILNLHYGLYKSLFQFRN